MIYDCRFLAIAICLKQETIAQFAWFFLLRIFFELREKAYFHTCDDEKESKTINGITKVALEDMDINKCKDCLHKNLKKKKKYKKHH